MLDIFRGDAFGVLPLSIAINNLKFILGYISGRGIFNEISVATTTVNIEIAITHSCPNWLTSFMGSQSSSIERCG